MRVDEENGGDYDDSDGWTDGGEGLALHNSGWMNGWRLRRRVQLGSSGVSQSVSQSVRVVKGNIWLVWVG